jgi:hypothetical protein
VRSVIDVHVSRRKPLGPAADLNSAAALGVRGEVRLRACQLSRWALMSTTEDRVCVSPFADVASYRSGLSPSSAAR